MARSEWNRKLDLSAAAAAKPDPKVLTDRQIAALQKAVAAHKRWMTRLKRATNAVNKHQRTIDYYGKILGQHILKGEKK